MATPQPLPAEEPMLTKRLMALPEELRIRIIGEMVRIDKRISLLIFPDSIKMRCLAFKHHDHLLAIAEEQAVRNNTFWWPFAAPAVTLEIENIRHLEMDLMLTLDGGDLSFPRTFDLPTLDAAKLTAIPYFFPKLATLTINIDHTPKVSPNAWYADFNGLLFPAAYFPEANDMEYCWKIAEILQRVRRLTFSQWRRDWAVRKKVVFKQVREMATVRKEGKMGDPTEIKDMGRYKRRIYRILEAVKTEVYFGEGGWDW